MGASLQGGLARVILGHAHEGLPAGGTMGSPGLGVAGAEERGGSNKLE